MALTVTPSELTATALTLTTAAQPNITSVGTLTTLTVDDITINSSTISDAADLGIASGGTLTLDIAGQIILDADSGGDILLKDGGTDYGKFSILNGDWVLTQPTANKDILFKGNDGNALTALKLDMSASGAATFNAAVTIGGNLSIAPASNTPYISGGTVSTVFRNNANSASLLTILDGGNVGIGITPPNTFSVGASGTVTTRYTSTDTSAFSLLMFENSGSIVFSADHGNSAASSDIVFKADGATEKMRIASTGIVTIRPDTGATTGTLRLHNGNGNGTLGQIDFGYSGSVHHGSIIYDANLDFHTGGSGDSRFYISQNGDVGINTTSPEHHLHVTEPGTSKEDGIVKIGGSSSGLGLELKYDQTGSTTTEIVANPTYTNTASLMRICVDRDANANQISLLGNGKTGFGTDTPYSNARVTVNGGIRFSTTPWSTGDALNVISSNTFSNFNVANTITTVYYKCFILTIYGSAGYNQCFFIANGGAGTGFGFTVLRPDSATPVSGNLTSGFTVDVTGNGQEDFLVAVTYGGGSLSVKRTAADNQSSSWGVFVHVLSG